MTKSSVVAAVLLSLAIGVGPAWAEDPAPAPAPNATTSSMSKKAISKACSDQANAKGPARQGAEEIQIRVQGCTAARRRSNA